MTSKRTIAAANETAFSDRVVKLVLYARLDFAAGVQRFHTEIGPKTAVHPIHGSESYLGVGDFGGISSKVVESISGAPKSLSISLSGVSGALLNSALTDDYFRRDAEVMVGLEDGAGDSIEDPEILFSGFMDKVNITLGDGLASMTLICESRGTNLLRASDFRFTDEDKQREVTGDLGAEYVWRMEDLQLTWGGRGVNPFPTPRGPGGRPPNTGGPGVVPK